MTRSTFRIGMVQMAMSEDRRANVRKAVEGVGEAADKGADVVCLPELFTSLYFPATRASLQSPEKHPGPPTTPQ